MRSRIYLDEKVPNKDRRFGQATEYFPVTVVTGKRRRIALLTGAQLAEGMTRYEANTEDVSPPSRWQRMASSFRRWLFG